MAPQKRKDNVGSSKTKETASDQSWRSEIDNLTLTDDRWTCVIGMIVGTRLDHERYLDLFSEAAEEQTREAIFSLSYTKLVRETKLLAKSDPRQGICHFASKQMDEVGEASMGVGLLCGLIKYFVNRAKIRNFEILENRVRTEGDIADEIETLASRPNPKEVKSLSVDKRNTKLRKRGEEWRDKVRIDDAPIGGPDLYVVLSGFYDPSLPSEMLRAGLPLVVVFRVTDLGEEEEVCTDDPSARDFWSVFEATWRNDEFGGVICQRFCPPEISRVQGGHEAARSDAYGRISSLMYDIADIIRLHKSYIGRMEIQPNLDQVRPKIQITETYDAIMELVPEECATVPIILDAILSQVEGLRISVDRKDEEKNLPSQIEYLNEKFDLIDVNEPENSLEDVDPRLILHGDDAGRNNYHCSWNNSIPEDFGVRVSRQSASALLWNQLPPPTRDQDAMHAYHLGLLTDCFDAETDTQTTRHYLHLLLFDKMLNGSLLRERQDVEEKASFPSLDAEDERAKSETIFCHESVTKTAPSQTRSDGEIEYGKEVRKTFECPELFRLVDAREMLGSPQTASPSFSCPDSGDFDLEDFDSVQLLSSDVFPQVFFNSIREFNSFETRYFAPTDSVLVVFYNDRPKNGFSERRYSASIRTPVCLRDFARFLMDEERDWIEREEEIHGSRLEEQAAALRKANAETSGDERCFYTDADFILPNSIKGSKIRKEKSRQSLINRTEISELSRDKLPARVDATGTGKGKQVKETNSPKGKGKGLPRRKGREINPGRESEENSRLETAASFPPLENTPSVSSVENRGPSTFLGYDIAKHRVQVSGSTSEFRSGDGTVVEVKREEWTHGEPKLQVIVKINGNHLVVHKVGEGDPTFGLTTLNGISVTFGPIREQRDSITEGNYQGSKMGDWSTEAAVHPGFGVSWASGLVVEILPGDCPSDAFNIKQSYLSKGPECTDVASETSRVYLRDGTIIVFRNDESVLLLRSNGRLVDCGSFSNEIRRTLNILRGTVLEPDGKRYEILNDEVVRELGEELVRTSSDFEVDEKFTRRGDGTNILIDSEGCLAVCFPDGSRITTAYVIDEHPVFCEWTEEEIRRFYPDNEETGSILEDDGFVSVLLNSCMEHKNYATVAYDQSRNDCTLSNPGDVRVRISHDTLGVTIGTATSLEVNSDEIVFTGRRGNSSVFNLGQSPYLRTTDSFGNVFTVDLDGTTTCEKSPTPRESDAQGCRLFAVNRDLSANEYLHRWDREAEEKKENAVNFCRRVPRQTSQRLCTTLTHLDPITASQAWLQTYRVPSIRPTNEDRRDLVRSTYSVPWNYLIPYGKNGRGIRDGVNANGPKYSRAKVLLGRTIRTIKNRGDNVIEKVQTALGRYWPKAINNFRKYRNFAGNGGPATFEEREFDDWLRDFALGRRKTFDETLYFDGLIENRTKPRSEREIPRPKSSELDKMAGEEIAWYKSCLRDRTIVPYFHDIRGACFLLALECADKVAGDKLDQNCDPQRGHHIQVQFQQQLFNHFYRY